MPDKKRFLKNMAYASMVADGIDPIAAQQYLNGEYKEGIKTDTEASKRNAKAAAATLGVIGATAAAPAVFPVLMNPVTAKTAVGAGAATLLDAYGVTSGIKGLSGAFDKARYGSFKWRDVPELGLNLTTLIPGSSVLTTPKNMATAARTANNIYQKGKLAVDTSKEVKGLRTFVPTENKVIPLSRPISEAERLGIPKDMRSNPKALEDPYYWGYQQWNQRYNAAISAGDVPEIQRLRTLHFITKAPNTKVIEATGMPKEVYHGSLRKKFTIFDSSKTRPDYDYGTSTNMFSDNKNVALGYTNNDPDKLHSVYLNLQNILERDFKGNPWNGSVNNSGRFAITPSYETIYSSKQEAETALQKMLDLYYPNNPAKQAEQRHYMYVTELADPPHLERSTNAFSDEITNNPILDGGIIKNVKDYYDLPKFDENPELYKELISPHTDYFVKDPRNIKSSAIITHDDFGRIIPIVKRDNFHNPDIRYKQGGNI